MAGQYDWTQEREPPLRPTPLTFPNLDPLLPPGSPDPNLTARLLALKKPADVGLGVLAAFNVSFNPPCDFETLLSSLPGDAVSYLPPTSWLEPPDHSEAVKPTPPETGNTLLSNGRTRPTWNDFYERAKELNYKNSDAFANLTRKATPDQPRVRLAHFRRFWDGLDNMAYYWDTSLDEYLPPKENDKTLSDEHASDSASERADHKEKKSEDDLPASTSQEPRKKAKRCSKDQDKAVSAAETTSAVESPPGRPMSIQSSKALPARTVPPRVPWATSSEPLGERPLDFSKGSYRGYRIGNGTEMPDPYRLECVRSFLEAIGWPFGVIFAAHRRPPLLCTQNLRFPVRMNTAAWRPSTDRMKARQGWMEGPILGIQCRSETGFGLKGSLQADSILDVTRELGGLLLLAQERAREGKTEKRAGEGKWWVTTPRWGGAPGGEIGEASGGDDPRLKPEEKAEKALKSRLGSSNRRLKPNPAEHWKILRPSNPLWDSKTVYEAIGKDQKSEWDEVDDTLPNSRLEY